MASAAYRSGQRLRDERTGLLHDYSHRQDDACIDSWIMSPPGAPSWTKDRTQLWNRAESAERRRDSRVAREVQVALPRELTEEQQRELVEGFVGERFVSHGMVADVSIHRGDRENPHVHIMLSTRPMDGVRFAARKPDREPGWADTPRDVREIRGYWERQVNRELERVGCEERISCRSHRDRGIDREPTTHEGPQVRAMEEQGIYTDRGAYNRGVMMRNAERDQRLAEEERTMQREEERQREEEAERQARHEDEAHRDRTEEERVADRRRRREERERAEREHERER